MQTIVNRQAEWFKLIEEQKASGLSKVTFCKQKGIKPAQFYYYQDSLSKLKHKKQLNTSSFLPIKIKNSTDQNRENNFIRLILKNGIECILPERINRDFLKEIVEVLLKC